MTQLEDISNVPGSLCLCPLPASACWLTSWVNPPQGDKHAQKLYATLTDMAASIGNSEKNEETFIESSQSKHSLPILDRNRVICPLPN